MTDSPRYSASHPVRLRDVDRWDITTDVAVVGLGAAGLCAVIEAASAGARVDAFEVAASHGGSASLAGGEIYVGGSGGTDVQRAAGFADSTEDFFRYLMMSGGPGADEARTRVYAEHGVEHFRWLQAQGVPFKGSYLPGKWLEPITDDTLIWCGNEAAWPYLRHARPAPRGHTPQLEGWGAGRLLMDTLAARAAELTAGIHFNSRVLTLIADDANHVHGMVARIDGNPIHVRARGGVILCAGGFVSNAAMLKLYAPLSGMCRIPITAGHDEGAGIRMGAGVGAATIHMDQLFCTMPFYPPESLVKGIMVNQRGQRFINEDAYHGTVTQHILRQDGGRAWLLVDNHIFDRPVINPDIVIAAVGESWGEVEQELQMPPETLSQTVEQFTRFALQGNDPMFHKAETWLHPLTQPPFAALSFCVDDYDVRFFTLGGLSTLPNGQVLNADGVVIPGLYAAGRTACGIPRWGEGYSSGMSLGDSTFFGRLAGRHCAAGTAGDS